MNRKIISLLELSIIILSVMAFSYLVSTNLPEVLQHPGESKIIQFLTRPIMPVVSAAETAENIPTGCCKETLSGTTCQDVLVVDKGICKTDLIGTGCNFVNECQRGCCYDADSGICSLNAPKESCTSNGGTWDASATCAIPQCQMGCCILGTNAAMMTTRECTKLSGTYKLDKIFKQLDAKGSCDSYANLLDEGACLTDAADYSGLKSCVFTTKGNCNGADQIFKKNYLCTSKELKTNCEKTENTACFDGKDQVYFMDSCGNRANVYDKFLAKNQSYWEKVISANLSCNGPAEYCGNCNYESGSICSKYYSGSNAVKPDMGSYSCKDLNCAGGKKNGESWCISDSDNTKDMSNGVGTRSYVATCFEGEIQIDGCADFNQEICIQNKDSTIKRTDAMCVINDWRSCIYANDADSYGAVKAKCDTLPQCIMFNDISGNEKYANLPGFKEIANDAQGRAGDVGSGMNKVMTYCVPKFTPGYQFWSSSSISNPFTKTTTQTESTASYGGSASETNSLCNLGSFTCISHIQTTSSIAGGSSSEDKENPECNMQAVDQSKQKVGLMVDGLNDRCRMLGSCGLQYNIQGELGRSGFDVNRVYIDKSGKSQAGYSTAGYNLTNTYKSTLKVNQAGNKLGSITSLTNLTSQKNGASLLTNFGSDISSSGSMIAGAFSGADSAASASSLTMIVGGVGALAGLGMMLTKPVAVTATAPASGSAAAYGAFAMVAFAAAAFTIGSLIGGMMASGQPPGEATVTTAAWAGGVTAFATGAAAATVYATAAWGGTTIGLGGFGVATAAAGASGFTSFAVAVCFIPIICIAIAIAAILYALFTTGVDNEYYVTEFKCEAWQPPLIGKCEECNSDVRPCSEDKCRSLGNNCHYFVENGEPGYCASLADVWNAKITPWNESLTAGNSYTNISNAGFKIINKNNVDNAVDAWTTLTLGIVTDKEAVCKIDINHSLNFDSMRYVMASSMDYTTGKVDGMHHKIALSPYSLMGQTGDAAGTTLPMKEGDNEYYIICQNFAGLVNDAPFIVQVKEAAGPDLTPPMITRFSPENNAYLAQNTTSLGLFAYLNEPATCTYSFDSSNTILQSQQNSDNGVVSMNPVNTAPKEDVTIGIYPNTTIETIDPNAKRMSCVTGAASGYYGEWMCAASVDNYTSGKKLYIQCKDQPDLIETTTVKRNVMNAEYGSNICETGLYITSIEPTGTLDMGSNTSLNLQVQTQGCINDGDATCSFKLPYYGDTYSYMLITGNKTHIQPLTSLGSGTRNVDVRCQDIAGNIATSHINFTINVDSSAPVLTRTFVDSGSLTIKTDEESQCLFTNNQTVGCDFGLENVTGEYSIIHTQNLKGISTNTFFIRCRDKYGNAPAGCTGVVRPNEM